MSDVVTAAVIAALASVVGSVLTFIIGMRSVRRSVSTSGFPVFLLGSVVFSLGLAPVFTLPIDLIVGVAPPERAGAASAIAETAGGGTLSLGSVLQQSTMPSDVCV
jgi:DHA2 family multidrug resistance protein-like MFS transporter